MAPINYGKEYSLSFIKKSDIILDYGCNKGIFIEFLLKKNKSIKNNIYGYDIDKSFKKKINKIANFIDNISKIKKKFDVITAFEVIEHMDYYQLVKFKKNIDKLLKKGGKLIISTPNIKNLEVMSSFWDDPQHKRPYTINSIERLFDKYKIIEKKYFSPLKNPIKIVRNLLLGLEPKVGLLIILEKK